LGPGPWYLPVLAEPALGCRGAVNFDLIVELREGGHHSGNWGGLIANPGVLFAHALASIVGSQGELLVEELKAPPMSEAVRAAIADIEIDGGETGPKVDTWWGEPDLTPAARAYGFTPHRAGIRDPSQKWMWSAVPGDAMPSVNQSKLAG